MHILRHKHTHPNNAAMCVCICTHHYWDKHPGRGIDWSSRVRQQERGEKRDSELLASGIMAVT